MLETETQEQNNASATSEAPAASMEVAEQTPEEVVSEAPLSESPAAAPAVAPVTDSTEPAPVDAVTNAPDSLRDEFIAWAHAGESHVRRDAEEIFAWFKERI